MEALDAILRTEIEPLQYAVFFGALLIFSALELLAARNPGAALRGRRWPLNYGLTAINILVIGAIPVSGVLVADFAQNSGVGLLNVLEITSAAALVIAFFARSFISWATHLAMHKVPLLWRIHRVHHTDMFLDVSTTVRFHPAEFLINTPVLLAAVLILGLSPVALMLYELFDAAMAVFTHANIRLPRPVERAMRALLVTPDMHRVHHSSYQPETDSNYGATLSIWDHLFRTYRSKSPQELAQMELGLSECQDDRTLSLWWLLSLPFRALRIPRIAHTTQSPAALPIGKAGLQ